MVAHHPRDHPADRTSFSLATRHVIRRKPIETAVGVVRRLLLRHQQREPIMPGECRPTGAVIVAGRRLAAAMQHDDERMGALKIFRHE